MPNCRHVPWQVTHLGFWRRGAQFVSVLVAFSLWVWWGHCERICYSTPVSSRLYSDCLAGSSYSDASEQLVSIYQNMLCITPCFLDTIYLPSQQMCLGNSTIIWNFSFSSDISKDTLKLEGIRLVWFLLICSSLLYCEWSLGLWAWWQVLNRWALCVSSPWSFETVSHSVPRLTLKLKCCCHHLPNAGITSVYYYNTQFILFYFGHAGGWTHCLLITQHAS